MTIDQCACCSAYDAKRNYCNKHLRGIEHILSCTSFGDQATIKMDVNGTGIRNDDTLPEGQRKILVDFLKNLRKSAMYGDHDGEFEIGFFRGWVTACNAALAVFGVDPNEK